MTAAPTSGGGTTTYSAPAAFALSGSQTLNVNVTGPIMGPVATFVVTATGFNGFSAGQLIGLSTDSNVKTASLSYSPLASVYAGQSVTVGLTPLGQGTPVAGGLQYCGVIDATSTGYSNSSVTLCAVINGATQSTSVAFPQPSTGYAVPVRGSIMVQAAVSQFGSSTPVSFTQSVKCPGVSNCTAGASLVSSSNGNLTIQFNAGNVPGGLSYTQQFVINNEEIDVPVYCDPGGGVVAPTIIPATSYSSGSNVVTLATDNDGSTNSANYTMSCGTYSPCGFGSMGTCVAQGAGSHVTLFQRAYGAAGATSFGFSLSATADDQATAGFYQIACSYLGSGPIAGSLAVYDATLVITSVSPGTVAACDTSLNNCPSITITGHNFGNNPTVTVGTASQSFPGTGISGQVSVTGTFQIPASAAGSTLPVTLTAAGESGNGFLQNPQNNGASHPGSGMASVNVASCAVPTVKITSRPIAFTSTGAAMSSGFGYIATLTSSVSIQGGTYSWTTDNSQMVTFITPASGSGASTVSLGTLQTNSAASITLSYTTPCGATAQNTFRFALSNPTTLVAWVDGSKIPIPNPLSSIEVIALATALEQPDSCGSMLLTWAGLGKRGFGSSTNGMGADAIAFANAWVLANSGNPAPPNPLPSMGLTPFLNILGQGNYRLLQSFQASYEVSNGLIDPGSVLYPQSYVDPQSGWTPNPCLPFGLPFLPAEPYSDNQVKGTTAAGDFVYQIAEGRVGPLGQQANQFLNGPAGGDYRIFTPYIWAVIQFDVNGKTQMLNTIGSTGNSPNIQIFPSYVLYSGITELFSVTEGAWQTFASLNASSIFGVR